MRGVAFQIKRGKMDYSKNGIRAIGSLFGKGEFLDTYTYSNKNNF